MGFLFAKMILIISNPSDISTTRVIDWFKNDTKYKLINIINIEEGINQNISAVVCNNIVRINNYNVIWFRKLPMIFQNETNKNEITNYLKSEIIEYLKTLKLLCHFSKSTFIFGSALYEQEDILKFRSLLLAARNGIKIPNTLLSNDKKEIETFLSKGEGVITKSIKNPTFLYSKTGKYSVKMYTEKVKNRDVKTGNNFPNLLQELILKSYELRIFFINNSFFSSALFTVTPHINLMDSRNTRKNDMRIVPYILPKPFLKKLKILISQLGLNTGSIDVIVTPKNDYIFLEINPFGQYDFISAPCNYQLDKFIANQIEMEYEK